MAAFSGPLLFLFQLVAVAISISSSSSSCLASSTSTRKLLVQEPQTQLLRYHNGPLLSGPISINLIWYGKFSPSQRAIISDFITSLTPSNQPPPSAAPSVAAWWSTTQKYNKKSKSSSAPPLTLALARHISDEAYSIGKKLSQKQIVGLASRGGQSHAVNVVLTASDVVVEGFCSSRCGTHGSARTTAGSKYAYIWVGNSERQCPGQCAWPFHQPIYGPQIPPLLAPNNDVGLDGMVINLGSLLAATATNPFGNGYFQGPADAPLEAASACPGVYGSGAYPGYPGNLLIDPVTGGSYNAQNGMRKYLLPALYDPSTSSCTTLV
uniref:Uncharacterized protein n=1 Tax=Kalanchoe fedtschenkoi TaxID=63787 RepID=A0A7N0UBB8_KALFE